MLPIAIARIEDPAAVRTAKLHPDSHRVDEVHLCRNLREREMWRADADVMTQVDHRPIWRVATVHVRDESFRGGSFRAVVHEGMNRDSCMLDPSLGDDVELVERPRGVDRVGKRALAQGSAAQPVFAVDRPQVSYEFKRRDRRKV